MTTMTRCSSVISSSKIRSAGMVPILFSSTLVTSLIMPRRRIRDLPDLVEDSDSDEGQHIDVAFIPNEYESSDGDSDCDPNEDTLSNELPSVSYEHVKSTYTSTQKLLEPNHKYSWKNDALNDISPHVESNFNISPISSLQSKNALELFEKKYS
ncbi:hypothetical protein TSAR_002294 [Trichomalopsis sarcophagae]|uniref:Uncharacterized protein n=1 Tax=Trichomalopsis sarcophagae TaxID=543379 RepID=A0A232F231_9HYME|nr:hypothetical protein TSAR_002294 [Trichomalopsis sarcophagae]